MDVGEFSQYLQAARQNNVKSFKLGELSVEFMPQEGNITHSPDVKMPTDAEMLLASTPFYEPK